MITISVQTDIKRATAALNDIAKKQIPFASAQAVNALAFEVQKAERANMGSVFAHPRPFTQNSVFVDKATKAHPTATIFVRPEVAKYLSPFERGGVHVLPGKALLDPKNIRLDQYGQLPKGAMQRLTARPDVFVGKVAGVMGVWQRMKNHSLKLMVRFGIALPVHKSLGFTAKAEALVKSRFTAVFNQALAKAIASAKK
jgi:hypothetical protein